jgi:hypothetical protein
MKSTKIAGSVIIGALLVLTAGCGKSKALTNAEQYQAETCACKDTACVTAAAKKFSDNAQDMASAKSGEAEAISKATSAAVECTTKIAMAGVPAMPGAPATK